MAQEEVGHRKEMRCYGPQYLATKATDCAAGSLGLQACSTAPHIHGQGST